MSHLQQMIDMQTQDGEHSDKISFCISSGFDGGGYLHIYCTNEFARNHQDVMIRIMCTLEDTEDYYRGRFEDICYLNHYRFIFEHKENAEQARNLLEAYFSNNLC